MGPAPAAAREDQANGSKPGPAAGKAPRQVGGHLQNSVSACRPATGSVAHDRLVASPSVSSLSSAPAGHPAAPSAAIAAACGTTAGSALLLIARARALQVKFMPTAPTRRRKTEPVARAVGVVDDGDLKHIVHVVRNDARSWDWSAGCSVHLSTHPRAGRHYIVLTLLLTFSPLENVLRRAVHRSPRAVCAFRQYPTQQKGIMQRGGGHWPLGCS